VKRAKPVEVRSMEGLGRISGLHSESANVSRNLDGSFIGQVCLSARLKRWT
jgi:hypothetical protein